MSAPVTKLRTIAALSQVAVQMTNGLYARKLSIPAGWTKVRIGARLHMTDSGADLPGTPTFAMGLCKGLNPVMGDTPVVGAHFAGINTLALGGNGANRGPTYYYSFFTQPVVQVGAVVTEGTDMATSVGTKWTVGNGAAAGTADVGMLLLDISKPLPGFSSQTYTFRAFWNFSATPAQIDLATFLTAMQADPPPATANYQLSLPQTMTVDEGTNGIFDAINFYYNPTAAAMEICTDAFCQLA